MSKKHKQEIQRRFEALDGNERQKLYKRAAQKRRHSRSASPQRRKRTVEEWLDDDHDHEEVVPMTRVPAARVADLMGEILAEEGGDDEHDAPGSDFETAVVIHVGPGTCSVRFADGGDDLDCRLAEPIARTQKSSLAVGDQVRVSVETARVEEVLPRRTSLSRPDPSGKQVDGRPLERVIAANIDVIVVVCALKTPPLRVGLIDRYLVAIERGGARPVICINKCDLGSDAERADAEEQLAPYVQIDVPLFFCSATECSGLTELSEYLGGVTCAFVGHSGVGKSSLLNGLAPELGLAVGDVGEHTGKGRHTTTASTLYELAWCFPEFTEHACRFSDCSHSHEPDCGVRSAAESGELCERRYRTYLSLLDTIP